MAGGAVSPTLQVDSLPAEPQGKPKNTGVGSLSLLQGIFPTQESNLDLLHCRQILYQLNYRVLQGQGSQMRDQGSQMRDQGLNNHPPPPMMVELRDGCPDSQAAVLWMLVSLPFSR